MTRPSCVGPGDTVGPMFPMANYLPGWGGP